MEPKEEKSSRTYSRSRGSSRSQAGWPGAPTSPYWDSYGHQDFSYQGGIANLEKTETFYDYGSDYSSFHTADRCGGGYRGGSSIGGMRRALQDPSVALGIMVAGAIATYILYTAVPTAFRGFKRKKRSGGEVDFRDLVWSGKMEGGLPSRWPPRGDSRRLLTWKWQRGVRRYLADSGVHRQAIPHHWPVTDVLANLTRNIDKKNILLFLNFLSQVWRSLRRR